MKRLIIIGVVVSLLLGFGTVATAGGLRSVIGPQEPFHFGLGALATWARDAGNPAGPYCLRDPNQYGLYLQKGTPTPDYAAAGAEIKVRNLTAARLTVLSFDISGVSGELFDAYGGSTHGYCGNGAPRFNVVSSSPALCFLGCHAGDKTQDPVSGWWTVKFVPPFTQYAGCEGGVSGDITGISIIFDEGNDVGPGNVVLDNITVNNKVFGSP